MALDPRAPPAPSPGHPLANRPLPRHRMASPAAAVGSVGWIVRLPSPRTPAPSSGHVLRAAARELRSRPSSPELGAPLREPAAAAGPAGFGCRPRRTRTERHDRNGPTADPLGVRRVRRRSPAPVGFTTAALAAPATGPVEPAPVGATAARDGVGCPRGCTPPVPAKPNRHIAGPTAHEAESRKPPCSYPPPSARPVLAERMQRSRVASASSAAPAVGPPAPHAPARCRRNAFEPRSGLLRVLHGRPSVTAPRRSGARCSAGIESTGG